MARCKRLAEYSNDDGPKDETETANTETTKDGQGALKHVQNPQAGTGTLTTERTPPPAANPPQTNQPNEQEQARAIPPVNFQNLAKESVHIGQHDELKRLLQVTESLKSDVDTLRQATQDKETQVRTLQSTMGEMQTENTTLKQEIERKPSAIDSYYKDVFEKQSNIRPMIDLNRSPLSKIALEGALIILKTMHTKPLELSDECETIDLFIDRPQTRFSEDVSTLQSLGISRTNPEHAFFTRCYMQFQTDPSFCSDGNHNNALAVAILSPGGAIAPRASALKKIPKKFRKLFLTQQSNKMTTNVPNFSLQLQNGGGLDTSEGLPQEVDAIMAEFIQNDL